MTLPTSPLETPVCSSCKGPGPVAVALFRQNVGALVMRFEKRIQGRMCRSCLSKHFWSYTLTTAAIGWLGVISILVAPIYVILNVVQYIKANRQLAQTAPAFGAAPIHPT